jgi:hypothetical protein
MNIKKNALITTLLLSATCMVTKADVPVFGNSPNGTSGFNIIIYNTSMDIGAAVEFTPTENINVSSITLWLSGYTGTGGQTMDVGIYSNSSFQIGTATNTPYTDLLNFTSPGANDGSLAAFTFTNPTGTPGGNPSGSTLLSANTHYWLAIDSQEIQGSGYYGDAVWVTGGTPTGDATYNGSVVYNHLPSTSINTSSITPAFTINAVPEPGFASLMGLPLVFFVGRSVYKRWKSDC